MGFAPLVVVLLIAAAVALLAGCMLYLASIGRDLLRALAHLDKLLRFLFVGADADDR